MTLPFRCYYVIVLREMSLVCLHLPSHRGEKSMWEKVTPNELSPVSRQRERQMPSGSGPLPWTYQKAAACNDHRPCVQVGEVRIQNRSSPKTSSAWAAAPGGKMLPRYSDSDRAGARPNSGAATDPRAFRKGWFDIFKVLSSLSIRHSRCYLGNIPYFSTSQQKNNFYFSESWHLYKPPTL